MKITEKVACFLVLILLLVGIFLPARPVQAAIGFHISGRDLLDANGNNFIMRGISHPHGLYKNQTNSFANWDHVTLYRNGVLVWGTEP